MEIEKIIRYASAGSGYVNALIDQGEWEAFKECCAGHSVSPSAILREMVKDYTYTPTGIEPAPRSKNEKNRNIRIDASDLARFKALCAEQGFSMADLIRALIHGFNEKVKHE